MAAECLVQSARDEMTVDELNQRGMRMNRLHELIRKASHCGKLSAKSKLLRHLIDELTKHRRSIVCQIEAKHQVTIERKRLNRLVTAELLSLAPEFDQVSFDFREETLSVVTPPIELHDVYLGKFEIRLDLSSLRNSSPYEVIAHDSSYATVDGTTHPHVSSNSLCEGTAQRPIQQALNDGRLFDFFMIVHQTLQTYNSGSAYISLSDWHGVECRECGDSIRDEDAYSCLLYTSDAADE